MGLGRSRLFVGRSAELDVLRQTADDARSGHAEVLIIEGEPGIGKTRLAAQFPDRILSPSDVVLRGHGLQLAGGELAYGVAAELVREAADRLGVESLRALVGEHAAPLAALHPALDETNAGDPVDRAALFSAFRHMVVSMGSEGLVCVIVDDLQWVDASSRDLLTFVARVSSQARVLIVCTVRTSRADVDPIAHELTELARADHSQTLTLRPLEADEVREQIVAVLGSDPSPDLLRLVQQRSDGVPLFIEELLASPDDLTTMLRLNLVDRLTGLSPGAQQYLDAAAVAEGHAYTALVSRVSGLDPPAADRGRDELLAAGLLEPATETRDRFHHGLLRDAVLARMTLATQQNWHRAWAQALTADPGPLPAGTRASVLGAHWYGTGDRSEQALKAVVEAAEVASQRAGLVEAAVWWERVLNLWPQDRPADETEQGTGLSRDAVLMRTMRSIDMAGYDPRVTGLIEAERANDPTASWTKQLYMSLEHARYSEVGTGQHPVGAPPDEIPDIVNRLLSEPPEDYSIWCLAILSIRYSAVLPTALVDRVISHYEAYARADGDREKLARFLEWLGYLETVRGNAGATVAVVEEWERLYDSADESHVSKVAMFAWNLAFAGEYERAAAAFPSQVLASTDAAVLSGWRESLGEAAWLRFILGDWDGALELIDRIVATIGPSDDPTAHAVRTRIAALRGRFAEAEQHLATAHTVVPPDETGCPLFRSREVPLAEADLHCARGDLGRAWAVAAGLLRAPVYGDGIEVDYESVLVAARILTAMAEPPADGEALVRSAMARVVALDRVDAAWRAEVQLRLGSDSDPDRWRDVVAAWDSAGHVHHACVARAALAGALISTRQREEATEVLGTAVAFAEALGAVPLLENLRSIAATARLPVAGAAPEELPREARRLTQRELEVLALVAAGRTNHDIADELFISYKTASVHVSHIIAKLEVSNRTEAAAYAHQNGILPPPGP